MDSISTCVVLHKGNALQTINDVVQKVPNLQRRNATREKHVFDFGKLPLLSCNDLISIREMFHTFVLIISSLWLFVPVLIHNTC